MRLFHFLWCGVYFRYAVAKFYRALIAYDLIALYSRRTANTASHQLDRSLHVLETGIMARVELLVVTMLAVSVSLTAAQFDSACLRGNSDCERCVKVSE